jgi:hypothetical protein
VGNRQVSRLIRDAHESGSALRVARAPAAAALPVLSDAAAKVLSELGVTDAQMAAFRAGELIAFQMPVPGSDPTIGLLQLQRRLVRGGIFDINVPTDADAALKSFFRARGVVLRVAKAVDAPEIELIGASVRNEKIEQMLIRQKFTRTAELIPESAGLGPSDTVEIYTKRFLVHGATADTAPGGSGAPPADPAPPAAAPPSVPIEGPAATGEGAATAAAEGAAESEAAGAAGEAAAVGLSFWETMGVSVAITFLVEASIGWLTHQKGVGDRKAQEFAAFLDAKLAGKIASAVQARALEARRMTIEHPEHPVYAIVSYDLDYRWTGQSSAAIGVPAKDLRYVDARFGGVRLGYQRRVNETLISSAGDFTDRIDTRRVTISVELNPLGESSEMRHWRALVHDAGQAAEQGQSARAVAESSHRDVPLTSADEREERRRAKLGLPSLRAERERKELMLWVSAYLEYTLLHGLDRQYDDALSYYRELEQAAAPARVPR